MNSIKYPTKGNIYLHLFLHIDKKRKLQLMLLGFLSVIAAITEIVSVGSILPLLGIFINPESIYLNKNLIVLMQIFNLTDPKSFLLAFILVFILAALLAGFFRLLLLWSQLMTGNLIGLDFSSKIYRNALYRPYLYHVSSNSSFLIASISTKASAVVGNTVVPILLVISSFIIVMGIMTALLLINFEIKKSPKISGLLFLFE